MPPGFDPEIHAAPPDYVGLVGIDSTCPRNDIGARMHSLSGRSLSGLWVCSYCDRGARPPARQPLTTNTQIAPADMGPTTQPWAWPTTTNPEGPTL